MLIPSSGRFRTAEGILRCTTTGGFVFIEEYLEDLRRERFAPRAVGRYLRRITGRGRENLDASTGAVRSVWTTALGFFTLSFAACAALAWTDDRHLAYILFLTTSIGLIVSFAGLTLAIGQLRDRDGYRLSALNVPLVLTMSRAALVPGLAVLLLQQRFALALGVYMIAVLTDVADGWVARRWNQITVLGTVLDPLVDIVFNFTLFAGLMASRLLPEWVFAMAGLRYGLLVVGGSCLYVFVGPVYIRPTTLGRFTGIIMAALVGLLMLLHVSGGVWAARLLPLTAIALGVLLTATVIQVLALGWYNLRMMRGDVHATGRVVGDVRWGKP
jgi:cardiolipin synthase